MKEPPSRRLFHFLHLGAKRLRRLRGGKRTTTICLLRILFKQLMVKTVQRQFETV
jgi:hypothetical protein